MADVMPNYHIEMQRLRHGIAQQHGNIIGQELAIMEMADRKLRMLENIAAARRAVAESEEKLKALEETHGPLTEEVKSGLMRTI